MNKPLFSKEHYGNFTLKKCTNISELNCHLLELVHEPTGAEILKIACDDEENVFNISFRTFPESSNGAAHVLEHIVLCGSKNFPVKDPFFAMNRRSLNTFMNALTGADFTCYPASTLIPADFYNLLNVYIDAVFRPRLLKESFLQEGVHLEFSEENNPQSDLKMKGIVYNEMKGAMANSESRLHERFFEEIFPHLPYRFNSGGNPKQLRNLTYQDVKDFHQKYYHPSQALYYFYGNLPLEKQLDFLEEHALKNVKKSPPLPLLLRQGRFKEKVRCVARYPISEGEEKKDKTLIAMGWLTTSILDQEELLALNVIDLALMGTDAAPLKKALLHSNLCKQADSGLDDELSEVPFILTFKGCAEDSAKELEKVVRETFSSLVKEGIPQHLIEGAIHQLEFARKEITGNSSPYGLSLFFRSGLLKQHGGDPIDGLKIHTLFKNLRKSAEDPQYFPSLIKKHFLDNPHFAEVVMHPDPELGQEEIKEEEEFLKKIQQSLSEKEKEKIIEQTKNLLIYQEEEGDLEVLPRLTLDDVPKEPQDFPLKEEEEHKLSLFYHDCFTNDIFYSSLYFDLPHVPKEDLAYLRLFSLLVPELGCGGRDYKALLDFVFQHTGGVNLDLDLFIQSDDLTQMKPMFSLRGKALQANVGKLITLYLEMLNSVDFTDTHRLKDLLKQHLEGLENSIQRSPLRYALNLAVSSFSDALKLHYHWYGLDYYEKVKEIFHDFSIEPLSFVKKMEEMKNILFGLKGGEFVISAPKEMYKDLKKEEFFGLSKMKGKPFTPWQKQGPLPSSIPSQGRIIAAPVAFTALAFPTVSYVHPLSTALSVASEIMDNMTLHKRIREQGGAYGGGSTHTASWGYFYFYAFRDPHLKSTLDAFKEAVDELLSGNFEDRDIEEAKFGILQGLDSPCPPESRALTAYTWKQSGRTKKIRQDHRGHLLAVSKKEIMEAAKDILLPGLTSGVLVSFAGKDLLEKENRLLKERALPIYSI